MDVKSMIKDLQKEADISTCSPEAQKGIRWLEKEVRFDEEKLETEKNRLTKFWPLDELDHYIERKRKAKYLCNESLEFYVLSRVISPLVEEFLEASKIKEFWIDRIPKGISEYLSDDPHLLWYLSKMGLNSNKYFKKALNVFIKDLQTVKGEIFSNELRHVGPMKVLALLEPNSKSTKMAVNYFLDNLDDFKDDLDNLAVGICVLSELNYSKYEETLKNLGNFLKDEQNDEGFWGDSLIKTSYAIPAISRIYRSQDSSVQKAIEWLKSQQNKDDGSWGYYKEFKNGKKKYIPNQKYTAHALLALMAIGEGPKVSIDKVETELSKLKQNYEHARPQFVHTSPTFHGEQITEIRNKIIEMLSKAKRSIRISSLRIDDLYGEIQNIKKQNPDLDIKILLSKKPVKGERAKIAGSAIEILKDATKGNVRFSNILHSRVVIIDEDEVLVSSADLDHTQLKDEFNAGVWTRDKETVRKAIKFFDNIWSLIKP